VGAKGDHMISSIELTVLGLISYKPMHGYKLCHFFENKGMDVLKEIKKPSVYAILKRFEKQELIIGEYEFDENNPPRKVYSITKNGTKFFQENLKEYLLNFSFFNPIEFWHLIRFSRSNISKDDFLLIINNMKQEIISHVANMGKKKNDLISNATLPETNFYNIMGSMLDTLHKANLKALNDFILFAENSGNDSYFLENEEG